MERGLIDLMRETECRERRDVYGDEQKRTHKKTECFSTVWIVVEKIEGVSTC